MRLLNSAAFLKKNLQVLISFLTIGGLIWSMVVPQQGVHAATNLTIEAITWNVIGLDSNNVMVGPNQFPVGGRVCNTGTTDATNVSVDFKWDDLNNDYTGDPYINLREGSLSDVTFASIPAGTCRDAYFEVTVTRNSGTYNKTRDYYMTVDSDQTSLISTTKPREVFVEHLISQNRNATDNVSYGTSEASLTGVGAGGSLNLQVGQTYYIKLDAHTATQGYNQLESFINFPNTIFQVIEVKTNYTANTSVYVANTNDMLYADACLWDNVTTSLTYRSCIGSDGKSGGTVTTTYKVKILSGAGTTQPLNTLLYDFSGSSFHYNSDFSSSVRFAVISSPLSLSKTFSPTTITTSGGTSTLTLAIGNTSTSQMDNVSISDPLPSGMVVASTPAPSLSAGCVGGTFAPVAGDATLTYTGSVVASGTCTLTVNVTASPDGSYTNTAELFWNGNTTGITAKDGLAVNTSTQACGAPQVLATWTFPTNIGSFTTINADAGSVLSGVGTQRGTGTVSQTVTGVSTFAWQMNGFSSNNGGFKFQIPNGNTYANLSIKVSYKAGSSSWTTPAFKIDSSINDSAYTNIYSNNTWDQGSWTTTSSVNANQTCSTAGCSTYFVLYGTGANANSSTLEIDNVEVTGCQLNILEKPRLSKAFSPDPVKVGETSTLTFTLTNANASSALTSVAFTDILPAGMKVAASPNASTTCTSATWAPAADDDATLTFSGGTIPQGSPGTCTAQVDVTVLSSGTFINTSGYISSAETGLNTNPYNDAKPGQGRDILTVTVGPPSIVKSFSPNPIPQNGKSILTFTVTNPNLNSALTNVSFTDNFPAEITATTSPTTTCTSSILTTSTASMIEMTGATLAAGATCTVSVEVTSATVNLTGHTNSVTVTSTEGGTGNASTDKLIVNPVNPELTLLKEISTSPSGPWSDVVNVAAGTNVYYRFTIENTGDVPLSPVWVTDNTLSQVSTCSWPATLPIASATTDPTASCVVGPVTAQTGSHVNTATAKGTYGGTNYSSNTSSATYATTSLTLDKSVTPTIFSAIGQQLTYTYTITNNGAATVTGTVAVTDSHTTAVCNQPGSLAVGAIVTCTATYTITAQDLAIGSVTNTASGSIGSTYTNTDKAISLADKPDMVVTKTNNITGGQAIQGTQFFWTLTISNNGGATGTFTNTRIISDTLPSGPTYDASVTVDISGLTNNSGTVTCSIVAQNLSCSANGIVTIEAGENYTVQLGVTPQTTDTLTNLVTVDPDNALTESNEGNNNGSNIVTVSAPLPDLTILKTNDVSNAATKDAKFNWALTVNNTGGATASFNNGNTILTDTLPTGPTYDATPTISITGVTGTIDCSIVGQLLSCVANGGVTIPVGATITVEVGVTSSSTGTLSNTAVVNPDFVFAESNTSNNTSTNSVTVYAPPTVSKSFSPTTIFTGGTSVLTLTLTNPAGNAGTLSSVKVEDDFGSTGILLKDTTFTFSPTSCGTVTKPDTSASAANDTAVLFSVSSLAVGASCQVQINVTSSTTGTATNTTKAPTALVGAVTLTGSTANANLTVNAKPDLTVTKTNDAANPAYTGVMFTWTMTVSNSGNTSTFANGDVVLRDPLPSGATYANLSGPTPVVSNLTCSIDGSNVLTCTAGAGGVTLAAGDSFDVSIEVTPTGAGSLSNTATVDYSSKVDESNEGNNTSTNAVTVIAKPDLTVLKTNNAASPAYVNAIFTWTMTVSNSGSTATFANGDVVLRDPLPSGATYANLTGPSPAVTNLTCAIDGSNILTCTAGVGGVTLTAGSSFEVSIDVTPTGAGTLSNTATVDPDTKVSEGNESNNTGSNDVTVVVRPDLNVSKTNNAASPAYTGAMFTWTMTVSNSDSTATFANGDVVLRDPLPSGATYANLTGPSPAVTNLSCAIDGSNIITCTASAGDVTLAAGSSFDVSVEVTPSGAGTLSNTATVDPDSKVTESNEGNNTGNDDVTVEGKSDLSVTKTNNAANPAYPNTAFTWTMTVSNSGNTTSFANGDVVLRDPLPTGATYANLTGPTPSVTNLSCAIDGSNIITCIAGVGGVTLSAGDSFAVTIDATPTGSGTLSNTATVDSGSKVDESNEGNNTGSDDVTVALTADLTITKTNNATDVVSGSSTSYTIVVTNNGPEAADGAIFNDPSAIGLNVTNVTCGNALNGAACPALADTTAALMQGGGIVIPTLPSGGSVTFTVTADVTATNGSVTNTATIDPPASVSDLDKTNNSASDTDSVNSPSVFDPPSVLKTFNAAGIPELEFRMVWINNGNAAAIVVQVTDDIPVGTTYVPNSLNCAPQGGSSTRNINASSPLNTTLSSCAFDSTANGGLGRIQWQGTIDPDPGIAAADPNAETNAASEVVITFRVTVDASTNQVSNVASSRTDVDDDSDFVEEQTLGTSILNSNQVVWSRGSSTASTDLEELPDELPKTGFAPNVITALPKQPVEKAYSATDVWLEVPSLGLKMPIVGVPLNGDDWDLSWLWNEAGWLEGTAFPSWQGNSVLTSHVTLPNGEVGPFASLYKLSWGDRVIIHAYGTVYTYEVRQNRIVSPYNTSILHHEEEAWLTLLTCKTYNEVTNTYTSRVAVRAVLISVAKDKLSSGKNVR